MADIRITELPVATVIDSLVDVLPVVTNTGTITSKATVDQSFGSVLNLIPSIGATLGGSGLVGTNTPMIMQSNGEVVAVTGTGSNISASSSNLGNRVANLVAVDRYDALNDLTDVLVVYQETSTHEIQAATGYINGDTIVWTAIVVLAVGASDNTTKPSISTDGASDIAFITYSPASDNQLYVVGVTFLDSIGVGTPVLVDSTYTTNQAVAASIFFNLNSIVYQTTDGGIRATCFSGSGTTITSIQPSIQLSPSTTTKIDLNAYDVGASFEPSGTLVALFQEDVTAAVSVLSYSPTGFYTGNLVLNDTTSLPGFNLSLNTFSSVLTGNVIDLLVAFAEHTTGILAAVVLEIDPTTYAITFGNRQTIDTNPTLGYGALSIQAHANDTIDIFYNSQAVNELKATRVQVDAGNIIKVDGTTVLTQEFNFVAVFTIATITTLQTIVFYNNGSGPPQEYLFYTASTTNLTDQNFVGFLNNVYAPGSFVPVNSYGHLITNLSGLTPGLRYYVTETGALSTTPGIPEVIAGTAVSTTSLLFNS